MISLHTVFFKRAGRNLDEQKATANSVQLL